MIRRLFLLGLLLAGLSGCTRWQRLPSVPSPDALARPIGLARVTPRQTGTMLVLYDVRVTADSVIGWRRDPDPSGLLSGPRRRMALHRDDVLVFERSAPNRGAGAAVVAVVTLVVVVSFAALHALYSASG